MEYFPEILNERTWLEVVGMRQNDVKDFDNISKVYKKKSLRTVAPNSSSDVLPTDSEGDSFSADNFFYYLVNINGSLKWQRAALSDF